MKPDEFEQRLPRQSWRRIPPAWREEILTAASRALPAREPIAGARQLSLVSRISGFLWPHPVAWAGLAAVWILIFAADFSIRDDAAIVATKTAPPEPEVIVQWRQQRRMLAELIGPRDARDADRSKSVVPQPRSERRFETMTV